jgi:hypothetical protein
LAYLTIAERHELRVLRASCLQYLNSRRFAQSWEKCVQMAIAGGVKRGQEGEGDGELRGFKYWNGVQVEMSSESRRESLVKQASARIVNQGDQVS